MEQILKLLAGWGILYSVYHDGDKRKVCAPPAGARGRLPESVGQSLAEVGTGVAE